MKIIVNGRKVEAGEGETILAALKRANIRVPTLCHFEGLPPSGACRVCVVEVEGMPGLIPACSYPVNEGMRIETHSPRAIRARKTIVELLLAEHPDDCLYCVRNGDCELADLASELGIRERRYTGARRTEHLDISSPAIVRDPDKCILCGKCVRMCEEIQGVAAIDFIERGSAAKIGCAFDQGLNVSSCINCGQCIMVCPTGALRESSDNKEIAEAIRDPEKIVVVQHAPSISVTLAEEFGVKPGLDICGAMTAALRRLGFDRVFETAFAADLTIMEEASELVQRITGGGKLPMMTSCSPGWIKFVEQFYPDLLEHISTCKSPQQMLGAVIKSHFAAKEGVDPKRIVSVAIMPCTAKKFEAGRPEMGLSGLADIDYVMTTRELARMIRLHGIELGEIDPEAPDVPFGVRSTAGKLFGATGGVMEAALRTAHFLVTGKELKDPRLTEVRGLGGIKEARVQVGELSLKVAVVSGLGNARKILDDIRAGRKDLHFIEVMTCPGGCIAGGGQPLAADISAIKARLQALYNIDQTEALRCSHLNQAVQSLYDEFLGAPLGHRSHELLHTTYGRRDVVK
jgi:NADH-quinone oxidoreductase subunit G/NADP-reducing hydrogenase subunit HndD